MSWDAIAVTCKTKQHADAVRIELDLRQKRGLLPKDIVLLCVEDPQEGLGSGGATLNALLIIAEHLSAKRKLTVVSTDILENARILIMHLGRYFSHDPCGRAFVSLPIAKSDEEMECAVTNYDVLYNLVTNQLNSKSPPGLWVCSSDMIISLPSDKDLSIDGLESTTGICCISIPAPGDYARNHGVYKIDKEGTVCDIIYKGTEESILSCLIDDKSNKVSLVSGIVFFSTTVAEKLLLLHTQSPVDACTYMGIDSGVEPIQISLYFDILLCIASDVSREDFICGKRGSSFGHESSSNLDENMVLVRKILWDQLRDVEMRAVVLQSGQHRYLDIIDTPLKYAAILREQEIVQYPGHTHTLRCNSFVEEGAVVADDCMLINSVIGKNVEIGDGCFIAHSHLEISKEKRNIEHHKVKIGKKCVIVSLDEEWYNTCLEDIPDGSFIMGCNIMLAGFGPKKIFCCLWDCDKISMSDNIADLLEFVSDDNCTNLVSRNDLLRMVVKTAAPLPPGYLNILPGAQDYDRGQHRTLFTAKLFPVVHVTQAVLPQDSFSLLKESYTATEFEKWKESWKFSLFDLLEQTDHVAQFQYRVEMSVKITCRKLKHNLTNSIQTDLSPLYKLAVVSGRHELVLSTLDEAALDCVASGKSHLCARVFSCMAEVLALIAGDDAGLRSGPAANASWKNALLLLESHELENGILALSKIRKNWMDTPDSLIRCARHYERAGHIFIRHACTTVSKFMRTFSGQIVSKDTWVVCDCATRIDLSGGWSDTPPVCYENGGSVLNVALLLEGKRPVGCRVRLIDEPVIKMTLLKSDHSSTTSITCKQLAQFRDYCQPQAQCALLKACVVLCEVISLDSDKTLRDQVIEKYGAGLEIQTWSNLPRGSGLGTSSILAGAIIMALCDAVGRVTDINTVLHAVIMIEQMLTTGGGWQDQVGGMVGGVKICSSKARLPLEVEVEPISITDDFRKILEGRMKLIYTGKTRLARNMLQDVLRNWYAKKPEITSNCKNLVSNTMKCKDAFVRGDIDAIGECVAEYWRQKKIMAPGCEPSSCKEIMRILEPYSIGQLLAGAGGGGFLCTILKKPLSKEFLQSLITGIKGAEHAAVYDATVDTIGTNLYKIPI